MPSNFEAKLDEALDIRLAPLIAEIRAFRTGHPAEVGNTQPLSVSTVRDGGSGQADLGLAQEFVNERVAYGTWTNEDRESFREAMQQFSEAEAEYVLSALFGAMNEGRLEIQTDGPPF